MAKGKELATRKAADVSTEVEDFLTEHAGEGHESLGSGGYEIPRIKLLQALSPEVDEGLGKSGQFFNPITQTAFDGPMTVIPCLRDEVVLEFRDRKSGGGFFGTHPVSQIKEVGATKNDKGQWEIPGSDNHYLVETFRFYVLVASDDGTWQPAELSMKISSAKIARRWNTLSSGQMLTTSDGKLVQAPLFGFTYTLSSVKEKNRKNEPYHNWGVSVGEKVGSRELVEQAIEFRKMIEAGVVQTAEDDLEEVTRAKTGPTDSNEF